MIDWEKSAELNNMEENKLRARFVRFPQSNKKVVAVLHRLFQKHGIEIPHIKE